MGCRGLYGIVVGCRGLCGFAWSCVGCMGTIWFYVVVWAVGDIMGLYGILWGCVGCITLTTIWDSRGVVGGCRWLKGLCGL